MNFTFLHSLHLCGWVCVFMCIGLRSWLTTTVYMFVYVFVHPSMLILHYYMFTALQVSSFIHSLHVCGWVGVCLWVHRWVGGLVPRTLIRTAPLLRRPLATWGCPRFENTANCLKFETLFFIGVWLFNCFFCTENKIGLWLCSQFLDHTWCVIFLQNWVSWNM